MGENGFAEGYAVGRDNSYGAQNGFMGGDWAWWIVILLIFGWGNNGWGGNGGGGAQNGYALATDFATIERKLDGVNNGLCDGFYAMNTGMLNGFGSIQNTLCQGFGGVNTALVQQGYETRLGTQALGAQLAQCCCDIKTGIQANTTQGVMNTNAIQQQIAQCCCENEKAIMGINYNMATQNCATLAAIDKLGDRIIDHMSATERQNLRDENFALRLAASQQAQNNYIVGALAPKQPIPAYPVFPTTSFAYPSGVTFGVNGNCGGCGCGNGSCC